MPKARSAVADVRWSPPVSGFTANFSATENPMSAGGIWVNGLTDGLDWNDCQTVSNRCIGSQDTLDPRYADDISQLKSSAFTANRAQWALATQYVAAGYNASTVIGSHECELHLLQAITASGGVGNARSYECSIGITTTGNAPPLGVYCFVVRWEGPVSIYTALWDPHGGIGSYVNTPTFPQNGDRWYAQITNAGVITLEQNEIVIGTVTDTTFTDGQPGLGFWPVDGADKTKAGWSSWACGNL